VFDRKKYLQICKKEKMQDVTVRLSFASQILLGSRHIFFDALISHICLRAALGDDFYTLSSKIPFANADQIIESKVPHPIKNMDGVMYSSVMEFYTSDGLVDPERDSKLITIYKRFDGLRSERIPTKKSKISVGSGLLRSYAMRIPAIVADHADVHVRCKPESLGLLLRHVTNIGKKYALGFGQVRSIEILNPIKKGIVHDGIALRPIPIEMCKHYTDMEIIPYKVPYWSRDNMRQCVPPGGQCELRSNYE